MFFRNRRMTCQLIAATAMARLASASPASTLDTKDEPAMQAILRADSALTTLINVFRVELDKADALVSLLQEGTRPSTN